MKTIKIFLASSDELAEERQKFGNLIRQLDDIFIKRGIHIQLLVWEDMDPCYNNCRKQDEYNAWIRESQLFVALFYTRAGQYTLEELNVAQQENARKMEPKLMIYCRSLQPGDVEENDLQEFKQTLDKELGHFWGNYATTDKLHLDFVMHFMRSTEGRSSALKVENGQVMLDGFTVASMDNLPFAAGNEGYQRMQSEIQELCKEIEGTRAKLEKKQQKLEKKKARLEKEPDDEDNQEEYEEAKEEVEYLTSKLQSKLDKYDALQEQFASHQKALLDTAKRVSEMQLETVNSELCRAVDEFEQGHIEAANAILDSIEREADRHMEQLDRDRELVHQDIEAFQLQAKTVMVDVSIPIDERIKKTSAIYAKADDWAQKSALDKKKYAKLLYKYGVFLYESTQYELSKAILNRQLSIIMDIYGEMHPLVSDSSYNYIGLNHYMIGEYEKAFAYFQKALEIRKEKYGLIHSETAEVLHNIGRVFHSQYKYEESLKYYFDALDIRVKVSESMIEIAQSYRSIGLLYTDMGYYDMALDYNEKALSIRKIELGEENEYTAQSECNIGYVYYNLGDFKKALEYYFKALTIQKKVHNDYHPSIAYSYNNIGGVYKRLGDYDHALEYYSKALDIREKILGLEHPDIATSYNNIGLVYYSIGDYDKALEYYSKALVIRKKVLGLEHPDIATSYNNIGLVYYSLGDYDKALEYYSKALDIREKVLGSEHPNTKNIQEKIDAVKRELEEQEK